MEIRLADLKIDDHRLTAGVGVVVAPRPILALLLVVESRILAIFVMAFGQPHAIRVILTIVPVVIIRIIIVINAYVGGAARDRERRKRGGGKQHRALQAFVRIMGFSSTFADTHGALGCAVYKQRSLYFIISLGLHSMNKKHDLRAESCGFLTGFTTQ